MIELIFNVNIKKHYLTIYGCINVLYYKFGY
jgi:hypothetical protein